MCRIRAALLLVASALWIACATSQVPDVEDRLDCADFKDMTTIKREIERLRGEVAKFEVKKSAKAEEQTDDLYSKIFQLHECVYARLLEDVNAALESEEVSEGTHAVLMRLYEEELTALRNRSGDKAERNALAERLARHGEVDIEASISLLRAHLLLIEFKSGSYELDLSTAIREKLVLIAELFAQRTERAQRYRDLSFRMHIDGHADSQTFRNTDDCGSALENKVLSEKRARKVLEALALEKTDQVVVDWFGNFNRIVEARDGGERENRRVEIRILVLEDESSHKSYQEMRRQRYPGGVLVHEAGQWRDPVCLEGPPAESWPYLSPEYQKFLDNEGPRDWQHENFEEPRKFFLGNDILMNDGGPCILYSGCA